MEYAGLVEAYVSHLDQLLNNPSHVNAPRGRQSREMLGASFVLSDPRRRLVPIPARQTNLVFNFAETLWYFAGRDDLAYLSYYAPNVGRFVSGASRLTGTAYGPRIFDFGADKIDQWSSVVRTLKDDPDSKRAVMQIFQPEELLASDNPDVACTLALQFLNRSGKLHAIGYMRANDAYRGMVSDVFSFTMLQELMARSLDLDLGTYSHMVGSLHVYEPDVPAVRRVLSADGFLPHAPMPAMPLGDPRPCVDRVMAVEERLRLDVFRLGRADLGRLELPDYWSHVVILFELYRQVRHGGPDGGDLLSLLPTLYRRLMLNRFPRITKYNPNMEDAS